MALPPIAPPAPPRLSTTKGWPSSRAMPSAAMRPTMSVEPPGGKGMISVTGFAGYCARADEQHSARSANSRVMVSAIDPRSGKVLKLRLGDCRHVSDLGRVAGRRQEPRALPPAGARGVARGAYRRPDERPRADPRGDEPAGR